MIAIRLKMFFEKINRCFSKKILLFIFALITSTAIFATVAVEQLKKESLPISDIERFTTVVDYIKNYYVETVEDEKLFENAIRGMLSGLDPHSAYLNKEEFEDLKLSTSGKFFGLGIEVTMQDGFIRVISPIDGTPAYKAGVKSGDIIIKLDDAPVKGMSLRDAVNKMRGKPGTSIELTIIREGENKPLFIEVIRDVINVKSVRSKIFHENLAYIRVANFQSDTGKEVIKAIDELRAKNEIKGVILDLRNNPGGVLDSSVQVADVFLDSQKLGFDKMIVYTKGRMISSQIKERSHTPDLLKGAPVVVLVNEGSASASEIVAGALQDHNRAVIMGKKTFGKGSVQTILPLREQIGLKLTTAFYYTPKGGSIQAEGIVPDVIVDSIRIPAPKKIENKRLFFSEKDLERHLKESENRNKHKKNVKKTKKNEKFKKRRESNKKDASSKATDKNAEKNQERDKDEALLIYKDYQLNEALNMLQGMVLLKSKR